APVVSFFSARLVVRFPFSHWDKPGNGARLNAINSGMVLFTFLFIVIHSIVEALVIEMLHCQVVFLRIGVVGRSVRFSEGLGSSELLARGGDTEKFCEPRFVSVADRRLAIRLNPFRMLPA